jgi:hypothetical protein
VTISDANWNSATDPFVQGTPSFGSTPAGAFVSGTNLKWLTFTGSNFLSGIVEDPERQIVLLVHDTDDSVEHMDQFHLYDDRTDSGASEWHEYTERWKNGSGDYIRDDIFAGIICVTGSSTCLLEGYYPSFPNNTYRVRVTRFPSYRLVTLAQAVFAAGMHVRDELGIWNDAGSGAFFRPRDFMDKAAFQANSAKFNHQTLDAVFRNGVTVEKLVMELVGQTADFATIRPSDSDAGDVKLHLYHHQDLPTRSDLVLSHDTQEVSRHVLSWELRTNVVEPITAIKAQWGHYHTREDADTPTQERFLKNDFPLDYKTGEDRFYVGMRPDNIAEMKFPNHVVANHGLDRSGILAQFPLYMRYKSQDELTVTFDWYGLNFMPGDLVQCFVDQVGLDETNGTGFVVIETEIANPIKGEVRVLLRRAWGIGSPHPYDWRDAEDSAGSEPAEDWPFIYSAENIRLVGDNSNVFGSTEDDYSKQWLNSVAHVIEKSGTAGARDYSGDSDENMIEYGALGALLKSPIDSNAPYGWPSVLFVTGGEQVVNATISSGPAILWWVWTPIDLNTLNDYLVYHFVDANNYFQVRTTGAGAGKISIEMRISGVLTTKEITVSEGSSGYVIVQFGGTDKVNVSGSEDTGVSWTTFLGVNSSVSIFFGCDGAGGNGPPSANIAEIGLVMPQTASSETADGMYAQVEAYIQEKYGA